MCSLDPNMVALGTKCGRVAIFDAHTMIQQELVVLANKLGSSGTGLHSGGDSLVVGDMLMAGIGAAPLLASENLHGNIPYGAVGSESESSMQQVKHVRTGPHKLGGGRGSSSAATGVGNDAVGNSSSTAGKVVTDMCSLPSAHLVLVAQRSGELSLIHLGTSKTSLLASIFTPSVVTRLPDPVYVKNGAVVNLSEARVTNRYQTDTVIATIAGDPQLLGVIRKGSSILELYHCQSATSTANGAGVTAAGLAPPAPRNILNVSLKTPPDVHAADESAQSAYFRPSAPAMHAVGYNLAISACHVVVSERTYVITLIGKMGGRDVPSQSQQKQKLKESQHQQQQTEQPVYLFSGSVTVSEDARCIHEDVNTTAAMMSSFSADYYGGVLSGGSLGLGGGEVDTSSAAYPYLITLRQRVLLDEQAVYSYSFFGRHCAICTADALYVLDTLRVYTSAPGVDLYSICKAIIPCHVGMLGRDATWAESTLSLTSDDLPDTLSSQLAAARDHELAEAVGIGKTAVRAGNNRTTTPGSASAAAAADKGLDYATAGGMDDDDASRDQSLWCKVLSLVVYRKYKSAVQKFRIKC